MTTRAVIGRYFANVPVSSRIGRIKTAAARACDRDDDHGDPWRKPCAPTGIWFFLTPDT